MSVESHVEERLVQTVLRGAVSLVEFDIEFVYVHVLMFNFLDSFVYDICHRAKYQTKCVRR